MMDVEPPLFGFVTAYSDHAILPFEAQAVDYLMKPVEEARLADTLDRVRLRLSEKRNVEEIEKLKEVLAEVAPEAAENMSDGGELPSNRFEKRKVGRASCREGGGQYGEIWVVAGSV